MEFTKEHQEKINVALQEFMKKQREQSMIDYDRTLASVVDKLESCGWTLPAELNIYAVNVIGKTDEVSDVDDFMLELYSGDEYERYKKMIDGIIKSPISEGVKKLVDESSFAFEHGKYAICADALVSAIEGILSTFWEDKANIRMMKICQAKVDELADEKEHKTKKYIWVSYNKFIRKLFEKNNFADEEPSFINRHWLLHGRSAYEIEEIDCLRLFNAISSICMIVKNEKPKHST